MTFRPTVLRVEPERERAWRGRTFVPGLFETTTRQGFEAMNAALKTRAESTR